ncbi:MAG: hypothetical protein ACRDK9_03205 [Solirubrobacterales bacterium]
MRSLAGRRRFENRLCSTSPTFRASSYMIPTTREMFRGTPSAQVRADRRSTASSLVGPKSAANRPIAYAYMRRVDAAGRGHSSNQRWAKLAQVSSVRLDSSRSRYRRSASRAALFVAHGPPGTQCCSPRSWNFATQVLPRLKTLMPPDSSPSWEIESPAQDGSCESDTPRPR